MRQLKITKSITNRESQSLEKYLQEIGKVDLLTPEEEVDLAKRIKEGDKESLEKLTKAKSKDAFNAKLGFIMAKQKALKILRGSSEVHVDDFIVKNASKKTIVVTQDKKLAQRLKKAGVRCLRYQQKKFIFQ
jgi:type III secretion system FlhB-like substrate exporter